MALDHRSQMSALDVRVDLCAGDIRVAQKRLDGAQIRPALEEMGRKRVAKDVGRDPRRIDPGRVRKTLEHLQDALARQMPATAF